MTTPDDLAVALKTDAAAQRTFEAFAPSHRREYIKWITEAKRPETRQKRITETLRQLRERTSGDSRTKQA